MRIFAITSAGLMIGWRAAGWVDVVLVEEEEEEKREELEEVKERRRWYRWNFKLCVREQIKVEYTVPNLGRRMQEGTATAPGG